MISSRVKPYRFYIGSTTDYVRRKAVHTLRLKKNIHHSRMMQAHCNKYGLEDLKFEVLEIIRNAEFLLIAEQSFINMFMPPFNSSLTAKNNLGIKLGPQSAQHRKRISTANTGRIVKESTRELRRKKLYKYTIQGDLIKTYNSLTEAREIEGANVMISTMRDPTSNGFVWVNDFAKIPNFQSLAERLKKAEKKLCKPVLQLDKDRRVLSEYESAKEASRQTGVHPSKICMVASGKRLFAGGFIWDFKEN